MSITATEIYKLVLNILKFDAIQFQVCTNMSNITSALCGEDLLSLPETLDYPQCLVEFVLLSL